jgi:hypothetical protein
LLSGEISRERKFALGDSLGQCCGGSVTLRFTKKSEIETESEASFHVVLFAVAQLLVRQAQVPADGAVKSVMLA